MLSREYTELEKLSDNELDELLPIGLDIIDYCPDYFKSVEENAEILRQKKIKAILAIKSHDKI